MSAYRIAVVVGSIRRESINRRLAVALTRLGPADFTFDLISVADLPLYSQDDDASQAEAVVKFKRSVEAAQGLIFVTPEYNRSIPGVLKNAIDHGSRPYGKSSWTGKPAGVIGASIGPIGTALAQQHLRNVLAHLDVPVMGQPEAFIHAKEGLFDAEGNIGPDSKAFVQKWVDHYVAWVRQHQPEGAATRS